MISGKSGAPGGSFDMSQFHAVFFEETAEHLANMEELLIRMNPADPDPEVLNAIFRAAHSIKGGSGTFGFHEMAGVTHELETLLDKARRNELRLTDTMVDALLQAGDVLKAQLAYFRGDMKSVDADVNQVCARIRAFVDGTDQGVVKGDADTPDAEWRTIEVRFQMPAAAAADGGMDRLLAALAGLGEVQSLDEGQPEPGKRGRKKARPTVALRLTTAATDADIRGLFGFVADPNSVAIRPAAAPVAAHGDGDGYGFFTDEPLAAATAAADPGYGFFDQEPAQSVPAQEQRENNYGRRATDHPGVSSARAGRRDGDKHVAAAHVEATSIRVSVEKVDQLINMVGELVITQAMLAETAATLDAAEHEALLAGIVQLERNTRDLQESVMSVRMMPIAVVFNRFPRLVRDLAGKLGKQVQLKTIGEGTELDRGLIEKIADPIVHLVRNSLDHGIETPEVRIANGKSAEGIVTLRAFHQGGSIVIEVGDDGGGLDRDKILAKARDRGLSVSDTMSDQEVWQLIFEAGFSTAEVVTDVSGRGVGMDVVRRNVLGMGGQVEIDSVCGVGTRISIRLPLTLAILDGMSIGVGQDTFILPLGNIVESLSPRESDIKSVAGNAHVVQVRGEYLPVIVLHEIFNIKPQSEELSHGIMVILEAEGVKTALKVDELIGQHQVVIKSLESNYRKVPGISGATIMGDGRVALILDIPALVRMSRQ